MAAFEVLALDTATPQIRAPGASDTYTFPRAVELPLGTANGVLYLNGSKVVSSGSSLTFNGTELSVGGPVRTGTDGSNVGLYLGASSIRQAATGGLFIDANSTGAAGGIFFRDSSGFTTRMQIDASGNLGLGVTPGAWGGGVAIQTRGAALWDSGVNNLYLAQNGFYNGSNWVYRNSFAAASYIQTNGLHIWYSAPPGTAGNTFAFSQQMYLNARGDLGIGGVTPPTLNGVSGVVGNYFNVVGGTGLYLSGNAYYDSAWKYYGTGTAGEYEIVNGEHRFRTTSVSGSAGGTISFTQAMTLDSGGNLLLGQTSDAFTSANRVVLGINGATDSSITLRAGGTLQGFLLGGASQFVIGSNALPIVFQRSSGGTESMRIDANGNVVINTAAIATNATNGFLYVPTCAGTPTGTPTTYTGRSPIVVDTTNNKLYFYSGGAWRDAGP